MFEIIEKRPLNPTVTLMRIHAPKVAKKAQAGQFIILRTDADGERIPLTVADYPAIDAFWADFEAEFPKIGNSKAKAELVLAKKMLRMLDKKWFVAGGMFDGDKLIALSLAE